MTGWTLDPQWKCIEQTICVPKNCRRTFGKWQFPPGALWHQAIGTHWVTRILLPCKRNLLQQVRWVRQWPKCQTKNSTSNIRLNELWARLPAPCQRVWPSTTPTTPHMPRSEPGFSLESSIWDSAKWTLPRCAALRPAKCFPSPTWSYTCAVLSTSLEKSGRRRRPACRTRSRSTRGT